MLNLRGKQYFFTYPKYGGDLEFIRRELSKRFDALGSVVRKYIIASERHADGDYHRHCYISLLGELRFKRKADFFDLDGNHPNIQICRSPAKVISYCTKDNEGDWITNIPHEVATCKAREQAKTRKTRAEIGSELLAGKSLQEVVNENPQYLIGFCRLKLDLQEWNTFTTPIDALAEPCGIWIGGPSGSGKTTISHTKFGNLYDKGNSEWWTGYSSDFDGVRIDDIDQSWSWVFSQLKQWAHEFPFTARFHGGQFRIRPKKIVVTSNYSIAELALKLNITDPQPWERRFKQFWITHWDQWDGEGASTDDDGAR